MSALACPACGSRKVKQLQAYPVGKVRGWRYLRDADAPPDIRPVENADVDLPPELRRDLKEAGLL